MQKLRKEEKPEDKLVRSVTKEGIWKDHIDQIMEKYQIQNQTRKLRRQGNYRQGTQTDK